MASQPPSKKQKTELSNPLTKKQVFGGLNVCIIEQGLGKTRCNIFTDQLKKHGAAVSKSLDTDIEYLLVSKDMKLERLFKILKRKQIKDDIHIVSVDWLSASLVSGKLENLKPYEKFVDRNNEKRDPSKQGNDSLNTKDEEDLTVRALPGSSSSSGVVLKPRTSYEELLALRNRKDLDSSPDEEEERTSPSDSKKDFTKVKSELPKGTWVCAKPSSSTNQKVNHNKHITEKLEVLQKTYENSKDKWRAMGYKKAINSIKNYSKSLSSFEEVKSLPFVGGRLAEKIWEIIETGHLRRLDHIDEKSELINKFAAVWGAGPSAAATWAAQGFESLEDLEKNADLTFQQKIGIKHYDDINQKMPREEVTEIEQHIRKIAEDVLPGIHMEICGSYRRGRSHCGDIDVLFSHPNDELRKSFLRAVLEKLKETNLITDDLICVNSEEQRKYMGVCRLPRENAKFRRIDFIVAPFNEWPLALMHFTGSAHFNRSIRLLAKKKNMSLSEHALRKDVIRVGGEKVNKGTSISISSEKDIFEYFGLDYLKPTDRDW
ncbi:DNA polymerase lambda-like [Clytia hemisphaerica]|uniref:DNA polymerase lambda-like n=1 Tax=Clytia hemisphaerica TaxID=252671 RepID=UPI0034D6BCCE